MASKNGYSGTTTITTTIQKTATSSPQGQRKKAPITTTAPPAPGILPSTKVEKDAVIQNNQMDKKPKRKLPEKKMEKWILRLFILGVLLFPLPSYFAGESIPVVWNVLYATSALYVVIYYTLRMFLSNELTVKRLMSGCFSLVLGGLPMYVLYFEPEFQSATTTHGVQTPTSDTAQGILLGFYCADMWLITPAQLNIPSLLVHHVSVVVFWVFSYFNPVTMTITMLAQMQEICNPFWYFHWIFFSSYLYKDPKWRFFFFLNAGLIMAGYVGLRLIWVQLRLTQYVWWMIWNYPPGAAFMVPAGIAIETVINGMNIYKLAKSILTSWNTPTERKRD